MFVYEFAPISRVPQVPEDTQVTKIEKKFTPTESADVLLDDTAHDGDHIEDRKCYVPREEDYMDSGQDPHLTREAGQEEDDEDEDESKKDDGEVEDDMLGDREVSKAESVNSSFASGRSRISGWHICNQCSYTTRIKFSLMRHAKVHSEPPVYKCDLCDRTFTRANLLTSHQKLHSKARPHACHACDAKFFRAAELARHARYQHPNEKPYKCEECDYSTVEKAKLKRHMRLHTGDRPFQCPHCTFAAKESFNLKRHILTHTGEKPYQCDVCEARFAQQNDMVIHKRTHLTDRPYRCTKCPSSYTRLAELNRHSLSMHAICRQFKCKQCGALISDKYQFKLHVQEHRKGFTHKCDRCDFVGGSTRSLSLHMVKKHQRHRVDAQPVELVGSFNHNNQCSSERS